MFTADFIAQLYFMVAVLYAMPWFASLAMRGTIPVTVRVWSLLVLLGTLAQVLWVLWEMRSIAPERLSAAWALLSPIILVSIIGMWLVTGSLIKMTVKSMKDKDDAFPE